MKGFFAMQKGLSSILKRLGFQGKNGLAGSCDRGRLSPSAHHDGGLLSIYAACGPNYNLFQNAADESFKLIL